MTSLVLMLLGQLFGQGKTGAVAPTPVTLYDGGVYVQNKAPIYVTLGDAGGSGGGTVPQPLAVTVLDGGVTILNPLPLYVTLGDAGSSGGAAIVQPLAVTVVDGGLNVNNFPTTQAVTGTFYQATQPVSGTVAVTGVTFPTIQAVTILDGGPISVTFPAIQAVTILDGGPITVNVNNFPSSQAVTGTFYQVTQPVSIVQPVAVTLVDGGPIVVQVSGSFYDGGNVNSLITDGTTGPVFVTPASTAPAAGNKALTVTISPNSAANTTPWVFQGKAGTASAESNLIVAGAEAHIDGSTPTQGGSGQQMALSGNQYGALYVQTFAPKHQWCGTGNINSQAKCFTHDSTDPTWVTDIMIYAVDAGAVVSIVAGAGNACDGGTPTPLLGPIYVPQGTTGFYPLIQPLKAPAAADDICCNIVSSSYCSLGGFISK